LPAVLVRGPSLGFVQHSALYFVACTAKVQKETPQILVILMAVFGFCTGFPQVEPRIHNLACGMVSLLKRTDLIRHLEQNGCVFVREGGSHSVYINPPLSAPVRFPDIAKSRIPR
jgi:predicted RNA binding protein YcfA (HicA-like mRNA interferase family)